MRYRWFAWVITFALLALTFVWYSALVIRFRTFGAIGVDAATYVQMALDLAERGVPTHSFSLFNKLYDQRLSWDALLTPGYRVVRETGSVVSNFAFGLPLLLAASYRIAGESGLYWTDPLLGGMSLAATFALGLELLRGQSPLRRGASASLAVLLLAATPKQIVHVLVPMSDVAAQLFAVLAMLFALYAVRPQNLAVPLARPLLFAALTGLCLGFGYLIRHSNIILLIPLAFIAAQWRAVHRVKALAVLVAAATAGIVMLPDLVYHQVVLGNLFAVESPESSQLVPAQAPLQLTMTVIALFSATGFGPAVLLAPLSWWVLKREEHTLAAGVLAAWVLTPVLFHSPLRLTGVFENNLRYLLPAYPAIGLSISVAAVWLFLRAREYAAAPSTRYTARAVLSYALAVACLAALFVAVRAVVSPDRFAARAYGWMSETARRDLDAVNRELPDNAVIGASDQMAAAVLLYAKRDVFRPNSFNKPEQEFPHLLDMMHAAGRPVFVLGDWECSSIAAPNEKLPAWLESYAQRELELVVRDLPYECAQRLREVQP